MKTDIERQSRRRSRVMRAGAVVLLTTLSGAIAASGRLAAGQTRAVDVVRTAAFVVLAAILVVQATTGLWFRWRRPELNDELTEYNRASAVRAGYFALMAAVVALYVASFLSPTSVAEAAPILVFVGAAAPALRFASLEIRAEAD